MSPILSPAIFALITANFKNPRGSAEGRGGVPKPHVAASGGGTPGEVYALESVLSFCLHAGPMAKNPGRPQAHKFLQIILEALLHDGGVGNRVGVR